MIDGTSWIRRHRRKYVKRLGKLAIRRLAGFLGRQSLVGDTPVLDAAAFPWVPALEAATPVIQRELAAVLRFRDDIPPFQAFSPDQKRIAYGEQWKVFMFYGFRYRADRNCARCPETARLLARIPRLQTAWFSILAPRATIPAHRGITKGLVRAHLGLRVPRDRDQCWMRVGDRTVHWDEACCVLFDDTYDHEVRNDTDEERVVLLLDVDRPMRWPGRVTNLAFLAAIRWTAYVTEARRNHQTWEERLDAAAQRADALGDAAGELLQDDDRAR
jgi:ornithine lipid ester-linked acyl 2-hydroxylase